MIEVPAQKAGLLPHADLPPEPGFRPDSHLFLPVVRPVSQFFPGHSAQRSSQLSELQDPRDNALFRLLLRIHYSRVFWVRTWQLLPYSLIGSSHHASSLLRAWPWTALNCLGDSRDSGLHLRRYVRWPTSRQT